MLEAAIAAFYVFGLASLCWQATREGTTVWVLLGRGFSDLARGMETVFAAVGLALQPAPTTKPRVSYNRIRQLERELGFDEAAEKRQRV